MKHSKKVLQEVFGNDKEGLKYIRRLLLEEKRPAPSLFVYSGDSTSSALDFLKWLDLVIDHGKIVTEAQFRKEGARIEASTLLIDSGDEVSEDLVNMVSRMQRQKKKLIVASKNRPKTLDYISDPALMITKIDSFDLDALKGEVSDLLKQVDKIKLK